MTNETKMYLFENTAALEAQKKEAASLPEYDLTRGEIERRHHHNMEKILVNGLSTEYNEYRKAHGLMKYYICTECADADKIYGNQYPTCLPETEVIRLCNEWGADLFAVMHEASAEEIAEYGIYE